MADQRPEPRNFSVVNSIRISPNMHRITLGGEGLIGFPPGRRGGYIKLRLSENDGGKPTVRTYTIRQETKDGLDVDFALHGKNEASGPATDWALNAKIGDSILIGGPGPAKPLPEGDGPFLLVGDMTALPAISVNLEDLPPTATGQTIILIRDITDKQSLKKPDGMTVTWITEEDLGCNPVLLDTAARQVKSIEDYAYAWVACEFEAMKLLRQYLRTDKNFGKERLYISSYWKRGLEEDAHKLIKRADTESTRQKTTKP